MLFFHSMEQVLYAAAATGKLPEVLGTWMRYSEDPKETFDQAVKAVTARDLTADQRNKVFASLNKDGKFYEKLILDGMVRKLGAEQRAAYNQVVLKRGSAFVTGPGGCGKTTSIYTMLRGLAYYYPTLKVIVSAMTAKIAQALHPKAVTFHKACGLRLGMESKEYYSEVLPDGSNLRTLRALETHYKEVDVLFVDEISMCAPGFLEKVDRAARTARNRPEPFGGIQLVTFGDMGQIEPVVTQEERLKMLKQLGRDKDLPPYCLEYRQALERLEKEHEDNPETVLPAYRRLCKELSLPPTYAIEHESWNSLYGPENTFYLSVPYRQSGDLDFASMLNRIRLGILLPEDMEVLRSYSVPESSKLDPDGMSYVEFEPGDKRPYLKLAPVWSEVHSVNAKAMDMIPGTKYPFKCLVKILHHKSFLQALAKLSREERDLLNTQFDRILDYLTQQTKEKPFGAAPKPRRMVHPSGIDDLDPDSEPALAKEVVDSGLANPLELKVGCCVYVTDNLSGGRLGTTKLVNGQFGKVVGFVDRTEEDEFCQFDVVDAYRGACNMKGIQTTKTSVVPDLSDPNCFSKGTDPNKLSPVVELHKISLDASSKVQKAKTRVIVGRKRICKNMPGQGWVLIYQLPLTLAYARTIHGSQGMSADAVEFNAKGLFCHGQFYVALSRLRALGKDRLRIVNFEVPKDSALCHPIVASYYAYLDRVVRARKRPLDE